MTSTCQNCGRAFDGQDLFCPACMGAEGTIRDLGAAIQAIGAQQAATKIGNYELLGKLGSGGMGEVYKAKHGTLGQIVAVKLLRRDTSGDMAALTERFHREAMISAKIDHPVVVRVHDVGEDERGLYMVMDYVDGAPLTDHLDGSMPIEQALALISQVAEALQVAHDNGIVHRDIKPDNILVDVEGNPRLLDFGVAGLQNDTKGLTHTGQLLGTPKYMSPEQVRGERNLDGRSDVFSLGAVLYQTLTGEQPFQGETVYQIIEGVATYDPQPPSKLRRDVPRAVDKAVRRAMAKDRAHRYGSAADFAADLQQLAEGGGGARRPGRRGGTPSGPRKARRPSSVHSNMGGERRRERRPSGVSRAGGRRLRRAGPPPAAIAGAAIGAAVALLCLVMLFGGGDDGDGVDGGDTVAAADRGDSGGSRRAGGGRDGGDDGGDDEGLDGGDEDGGDDDGADGGDGDGGDDGGAGSGSGDGSGSAEGSGSGPTDERLAKLSEAVDDLRMKDPPSSAEDWQECISAWKRLAVDAKGTWMAEQVASEVEDAERGFEIFAKGKFDELAAQAEQHTWRQNFDEAIRVLDSLPAGLRTEETTRLLAMAKAKVEQARRNGGGGSSTQPPIGPGSGSGSGSGPISIKIPEGVVMEREDRNPHEHGWRISQMLLTAQPWPQLGPAKVRALNPEGAPDARMYLWLDSGGTSHHIKDGYFSVELNISKGAAVIGLRSKPDAKFPRVTFKPGKRGVVAGKSFRAHFVVRNGRWWHWVGNPRTARARRIKKGWTSEGAWMIAAPGGSDFTWATPLMQIPRLGSKLDPKVYQGSAQKR